MSSFDDVKEKASDVAEGLKHKVASASEHTKAEAHEAKAEHEDRQSDIDLAPDRSDRLKP